MVRMKPPSDVFVNISLLSSLVGRFKDIARGNSTEIDAGAVQLDRSNPVLKRLLA